MVPGQLWTNAGAPAKTWLVSKQHFKKAVKLKIVLHASERNGCWRCIHCKKAPGFRKNLPCVPQQTNYSYFIARLAAMAPGFLSVVMKNFNVSFMLTKDTFSDNFQEDLLEFPGSPSGTAGRGDHPALHRCGLPSLPGWLSPILVELDGATLALCSAVVYTRKIAPAMN